MEPIKMDHSEVSECLKKWFIAEYPGEFLFQNSSGHASQEHVKYGLPNTGGGFDYISAQTGGVVQFFEVKTDGYPTLSKKQKIFARNMTSKGFKCWVFRGCGDQCYLIPAEQYKPSKLTGNFLI